MDVCSRTSFEFNDFSEGNFWPMPYDQYPYNQPGCERHRRPCLSSLVPPLYTSLSSTASPGLLGPSGATSQTRSASRRKRTSFSKEHVELLKATFQTDPYPGISIRESLSQTTGLPESRIQVWFQNRRARTLKGKSSCKTSWQPEVLSTHPAPTAFPATPPTGSAVMLPGALGRPLLYSTYPPVKEEEVEGCFWSPSYHPATGNVRYREARLPGTSASPPLWTPPLEPGGQVFFPQTPVQPLSLENPTNCSTPIQMAMPNSPDSGYWEMRQGNMPSTSQCSQSLEQNWGMVGSPGLEMAAPLEDQHHQAPLPELLLDTLEELLGDLQPETTQNQLFHS